MYPHYCCVREVANAIRRTHTSNALLLHILAFLIDSLGSKLTIFKLRLLSLRQYGFNI
jgi:hypothetical protein